MTIKMLITVILSLLLVFTIAAPAYAAMTTEEKDERYRTAVLELEAYLESFGTSETSLEGIEAVFKSLGGYMQSRPLMYYTQVLKKLEADDYGFDLYSLLTLLEQNERFGEYLEETMKDSSIMPVRYLSDYTAGRRKEFEGDAEGAMGDYAKCLGFFDSDERYAGINHDIYESAYREAMALLDKGDFAGAYYAFEQTGHSMDSDERRASIVTMLGYTPENAADNPEPVTGLQVSGQEAGRAVLTWNSAAHAGGYEVAYRESGTQDWTVSGTTDENMATVSGLIMDTAYDFRVTAIVGTVRMENAELAGVWMAMPTPTPPVLQAASGLKSQKTDQTSVTLVWNSVPYAEGYRVMVKERSASNWQERAYATVTTARITGLSAGTEYQFRVIAENGGVRSESEIFTTKTIAPAPTYKAVKVGEYITFGHYEQDNNTGNGKEPIDWLVLEVRGDRALLISRYGLDCKPYNTNNADVTWEKCSLRKWLNETFLNNAFSVKEQTAIVLTPVDNGVGQGFDWTTIGGEKTGGGNNTEDRVFLLSCTEANKYLGVTWENADNMKSRMSPTTYALQGRAHINSAYETEDGAAAGWWWLRSPGYRQYFTAVISTDGSLDYGSVDNAGVCVRPAMWVKLDPGII